MAVPYVPQLHREAGFAPTRPRQVRRVDQVAHDESPALVVLADVGILRRPPLSFFGAVAGQQTHPAHRR